MTTDLPQESITLSAISGANKEGYPENSSGTLIAYCIGGFGWDKTWYFEEYHLYNSNKKYTRHSGTDGSWQPWINPYLDTAYHVVLSMPKDTYDGLTQPKDFPTGKIIYTTVGNGVLGLPNTYSACLMTSTVGSTIVGDYGYIYQEWRKYGENRFFTRAAVNATTWADWVEII